MGLDVVRLKLDGALIIANRLMGIAQPARDISQTVVGLGVFVFGFDDLCQIRARILVVLGITEGYAEIIFCPRKIWVERNALTIRKNGFVKLTLLVKFVTALEMKGRRLQHLLICW